MFKAINCCAIAQGSFITVTLLFIVTVFMLLNRSHQLKKKLSNMLEALTLKNKELEELRLSNQNILSPFIPETSKSIIVSVDQFGSIMNVNDYAMEIFGYDKEELIGKDAFGTIFPPQDKNDPLQANIIPRILSNPKLYVEHETENIKKSGEHFWISWTNRVIYDDQGNPTEIRSVGFDITKRKRLEEELRFLSSIDPLSGAMNRQAFLETGTHELKRAKRYHRELSVLVMKLDYFHDIDDSTGLSDEMIQKMIQICRKSTRDSDCIGRVGDVEFGIILPETSSENAVFLADRLKDEIQKSNLTEVNHSFVSATFGIAGKKDDQDTIDSLLLEALNNLQAADKLSRQKRTSKESTRKGS